MYKRDWERLVRAVNFSAESYSDSRPGLAERAKREAAAFARLPQPKNLDEMTERKHAAWSMMEAWSLSVD
jgi:hypothetical protein